MQAPPEDTKPSGVLFTLSDTRPQTPVRAATYHVMPLVLAAVVALAVVIAVGGGMVYLYMQSQNTEPRPTINVQLQIEGRTYTVTTGAATVADLLRQEGVQLDEHSVVAPALETALTPGIKITISSERTVTVTIDGETSVFRTIFTYPLDILESVGFYPDEYDEIRVNGTRIMVANLGNYALPVDEIIAWNAIQVTINADGETHETQTTAATVGDALTEAGISIFLGDRVTPEVDTPINAEMTITVERSRPVNILVDGVTIETRTLAPTVAEALTEAGVILTGLDYAIPPEVAKLDDTSQIQVVRVTEQIETTQEPVPYEAVYQADAELELDQQQVIQSGVSGIQQHNIRVRYENGVEISRMDEGMSITQEPVNQIIAYGTKIVLRVVETPEGPREYWRVLRVYATSYHPAALGGDDITATGRKLMKGIVGIDPKLIPYDTNVYVEGYGIGVAADTGGPRRSRYWIDLGYSDADWVSWSRNVDVYLLTPVPPDFPLILPPQ